MAAPRSTNPPARPGAKLRKNRFPSVFPRVEAELLRQSVCLSALAREIGCHPSRTHHALVAFPDTSCGPDIQRRIAAALGFETDDKTVAWLFDRSAK